MDENEIPGDPLLESMRASLSRITEDNKARFIEFMRLAGPPGLFGLQLDMLNVRVFTLARMIFGDNSRSLVQFQLEFEGQAARMLDDALRAVRQSQLGAQMSPQEVQQMARSQGLLGPDGNAIRR